MSENTPTPQAQIIELTKQLETERSKIIRQSEAIGLLTGSLEACEHQVESDLWSRIQTALARSKEIQQAATQNNTK